MLNLDLNDYIAGGYFLVKRKPRREWISADLMPAEIISLSNCISLVFKITWGWHPGNPEAAIEFGIPAERLPDLGHYPYDEGLPETFAHMATVRDFIARFLPNPTPQHYLLGAGLHREQVQQYWADDAMIEKYGYEAIGKVVQLGLPLASGGTPLGFEVVGHDYGMGCSWLCSYLERKMHELFNIRPNALGLLDTYAEGKQICDWIEEGEVGTRAEPIPYDPWLLVAYPL